MWSSPIILEPEDVDVISDSLARQVLLHNELYEQHCKGKQP